MFFIRHGQSTFNVVYDRTGGDPQIPDAPLSPLGVKQVEAAAARLAGKGLRQIVSSPYTRALQTAHILADALKIPVAVEALVGERRLYSCDIGRPVATLKKEFPQADFGAMDEKAEWWLPFHESAEGLAARVQAFRSEWDWRQEADKTLVASHWYFILASTGAGLDNAQITEI